MTGQDSADGDGSTPRRPEEPEEPERPDGPGGPERPEGPRGPRQPPVKPGEPGEPGEGDGGGPAAPGGPAPRKHEHPRIPSPRRAAEDSGRWTAHGRPREARGGERAPDEPAAPDDPDPDAGPGPDRVPALAAPPGPTPDTDPGDPDDDPPDAYPTLDHVAETHPDADPQAAASAWDPDSAPAGSGELRVPAPAGPSRPPPSRPGSPPHHALRSLLGVWALSACDEEEAAAVEAHLPHCAACAEEAARLRKAAALLSPTHSLDLDPLLRSRVLDGCLGRRPARVPVPAWAAAYDAEAARLDALLRDMGGGEWRAAVRLRWFDGLRVVGRNTSVSGVIGHLFAVDGAVAAFLGMPDPLGAWAPASLEERTEAYWRATPGLGPAGPATRGTATRVPAPGRGPAPDGDPPAPGPGAPGAVRESWREQGHALVRTVSFAGRGIAELPLEFGGLPLTVRDVFIDRAFECWLHAVDIAGAVHYPYGPPADEHLAGMVDLYARLLPTVLAARRRAGLAGPPRGLVAAGRPGRSLRLEVESCGTWHIALDSPGAVASEAGVVAGIALDREAFLELAAGHVPPWEAAAARAGDEEAVRDVLFALASLSRM
ncbi:immediate early protein [Streptomyces sp. B1866]|nr:immediate early protein [Streptomyces sp. B1866]